MGGRFRWRVILEFVIGTGVWWKRALAPDGKIEIVVLHFANVKKSGPVVGIKFSDIVGTAIPEGCASAKRTCTYDRDLSVCSVPEPCVEELWPVLMAVKAEAEPAIDQILEKVRVHIVRMLR